MLDSDEKKELESTRAQVLRILEKKENRLLRQLSEWETQLDKAHKWEEYFHEGKLLQSRFFEVKKGMHSISIPDWNESMNPKTISLDPFKDPQENLAAIFKKAKKLQKGVPHLEDLVKKKREEIEQLRITMHLAETTTDPLFLQQWLPSPEKTREKAEIKAYKEALPYKEFSSSTGIPIFVGKNGKANDKLTFQVAHGNDWWLHVSGMSGSHVIIRHPAPDHATIEEAMALAIEYSKAKNAGEAEVIVTQKKFVSKAPRGKPGQVQISQHKCYYKKIHQK